MWTASPHQSSAKTRNATVPSTDPRSLQDLLREPGPLIDLVPEVLVGLDGGQKFLEGLRLSDIDLSCSSLFESGVPGSPLSLHRCPP